MLTMQNLDLLRFSTLNFCLPTPPFLYYVFLLLLPAGPDSSQAPGKLSPSTDKTHKDGTKEHQDASPNSLAPAQNDPTLVGQEILT